MPKSKKRSADKPVEDLDEELGSPSNRSRISEAGDEDGNAVKQEDNEEIEHEQEKNRKEDQQEEEGDSEEEGEQYDNNVSQESDGESNDCQRVKGEEDMPLEEDQEEKEEEEDAENKDSDDGEKASNTNNDEEEDEQMEEGNEDDEENAPPIRKINVEGRPAEAGVIKTIVVENFMCHRKLKVELCRNVNFIHGQNGSGKSAILAAIQICLGANARRTHRARCIKDLVRKEAAGTNPNSCAKVRVTLLNGGEDGYKQDLYGDKITVERTIQLRSGFNGYKLLDANGKEVSRKKCDLDDMLDFLNIQVENPVAILDQEDAKKFLTGKASNKYEFFMKATELQRIDKVFAAIEDRADELSGQQQRLGESLARKVEIVKTLKKRVDEFQAVEKLEKQRLDLEIDYSWAFFGERNGEYEECVQNMDTFQTKVKAKQDELTQAEEEASGANDEDEEKRIRERMQELQNEAESQAKLKRDLEAEAKLAQNPVKQANRQLKKLDAEKSDAKQDLSRAKKRLKETREEILAKAGSAESEEAKRQARLAETEEALTQAKNQTDQVNEAVGLAYRAYEEQEPEYEQAKQMAATKGKQVYAVKSKLRDFDAAESNDPAALFGKKCSQMVKLVEQARQKRQFRDEVVGPIGAFLRIAPGKEKYAEVAEMAMGNGTLDRFIVTNDQDRKTFQKLREQLSCFRECGVFQSKKVARFNVPPPPSPEIETVASVLIVSNDTVFNCLVDNARIDQFALAETKEISEQHLLASDNGRYRIKGNINQVAFLPRGDKWTVRDGAISLSSNTKKGGKKIGVDRTQAIKEAETEVRLLEGELKELKAAETTMRKEHLELQKKWNVCNKIKRANQAKIEELTRKKDEIENEIETTATTTIDTTEMEEDVAAAEDTLEKISEEQAEIKKELESLQPAVEEAKKKLEEVETRNEKVLQDMKEAEDSLVACEQRQRQSEVVLEKKRAKIKKYQDVLSKHQEKIDGATEERDTALDKARRLTLRRTQKEELELEQEGEEEGALPSQASQGNTQNFTDEQLEQVEIREVPKSSDSYAAKLTRTKTKIVKEKERRDLSNEDPTEATEKYLSANLDLKETQQAATEAAALHQQTLRDLRERRKRWGRLRKYLENMTDSRFDSILRLNQSCGELEFDDEKHELNLIVQKNLNDPDSQTKDVKALSGGERSYTTISLLLALGESLETPFRVLDEFDVFLDPQARKLTIQTLIHVAKKMEHRQFIFITPQDLSSVKPDAKVKIFGLKPPERAQRAGGPTQQTLDFSQS